MAFINLMDLIYPIGSIYLSTDSASPGAKIGGIWEILPHDKYLLFANTSTKAGSIGGSSSFTLTVANMPSHAHKLNYTSVTGNVGAGTVKTDGIITSDLQHQLLASTNNVGSGTAKTFWPPYYYIYGWRRIA